MKSFRPGAVMAMLALAAPLPAQEMPEAEMEQRAAVLVYRQALHPEGRALALAARVLTERAGGGAESGALKDLRGRVLEAARDRTPPAPTMPGEVPDQLDVLVDHHADGRIDPGPPDLLAAWQAYESRDDIRGLLPYLLAEAQAGAGGIWHAALRAAADDAVLAEALAPVIRELSGADPRAPLAAWLAVEPALERGRLSVGPENAWRANVLGALASALDDPGAVSPVITARLRARWYLAARSGGAGGATPALTALWIGLRANTGALAERDPLPFLAVLARGAQRLAVGEEPLSDAHRRDLGAMVEMLRGIPAETVDRWSGVDRRLPAVFRSVLETLSAAAGRESGQRPSASSLAMAGARVDLLDDNWDAYLMQPFREPIRQALAACLPPGGDAAAECRRRFRDWGIQGAGIPEASGDVAGPFQTENLLRELDLNPWQRVNYLRGFWRQLLARECTARPRIHNPVEWALAARAFLAVLPGDTVPGEDAGGSGLERLAESGLALAADLTEFGNCRVEGRGPVGQVLAGYRDAVDRLAGALERAGEAFLEGEFAAGADIGLDAGPYQETRYAPPDLTIGPCDATPSCGVSLSLPASPELYHRFPAPYRVADQSGLGSLSLCYSDVAWVDRRAEPVEASGGVMANFRGRLGFSLRGRYQAGGEERDVFVLRMVTDEAHTYLFAPDRPAVLADPCPRQYQGQMATGELPEKRGWLVPRRLTFLSGQRRSPAQLMVENWMDGALWLDRLAAGEGVVLERAASGEEAADRVARHLEQMRERQRAHLYEHMLAAMAGDGETPVARELTAVTRELAAMRSALDASVRVLVPRTAMLDPWRRGLLYGDGALVGLAEIRDWREQGRDPMALPDQARDRVERAIKAWRIPSARTEMAPFVAHALIDLLAARARAGSQ